MIYPISAAAIWKDSVDDIFALEEVVGPDGDWRFGVG